MCNTLGLETVGRLIEKCDKQGPETVKQLQADLDAAQRAVSIIA